MDDKVITRLFYLPLYLQGKIMNRLLNMRVVDVSVIVAEMKKRGCTSVEIINYLNTLTDDQKFPVVAIKPTKTIALGHSATARIVTVKTVM